MEMRCTSKIIRSRTGDLRDHSQDYKSLKSKVSYEFARDKPYAGIPLVRICPGGAGKPAFLPGKSGLLCIASAGAS